MKRMLYLSLLATILAQGASSPTAAFPVSPDESLEPVSDAQSSEYYTPIQYLVVQSVYGIISPDRLKHRCKKLLRDPRTYASIQLYTTKTIDTILRQKKLGTRIEELLKSSTLAATKKLRHETFPYHRSICRNGEIRHEALEHLFMTTSCAEVHQTLIDFGFNNELVWNNRKLLSKGTALFTESIFDPSTRKALDNTFSTTNEKQALEAWQEFSRVFDSNLLRKLNVKIPGIQLKPTVYETIKANAHIKLTSKQEIDYMAAQLAIAYSLSLQLEMVPAIFEKMALESLQKASEATAGPLCSAIISDDTPRTGQVTSSCTSSTDYYDY